MILVVQTLVQEYKKNTKKSTKKHDFDGANPGARIHKKLQNQHKNMISVVQTLVQEYTKNYKINKT